MNNFIKKQEIDAVLFCMKQKEQAIQALRVVESTLNDKINALSKYCPMQEGEVWYHDGKTFSVKSPPRAFISGDSVRFSVAVLYPDSWGVRGRGGSSTINVDLTLPPSSKLLDPGVQPNESEN